MSPADSAGPPPELPASRAAAPHPPRLPHAGVYSTRTFLRPLPAPCRSLPARECGHVRRRCAMTSPHGYVYAPDSVVGAGKSLMCCYGDTWCLFLWKPGRGRAAPGALERSEKGSSSGSNPASVTSASGAILRTNSCTPRLLVYPKVNMINHLSPDP